MISFDPFVWKSEPPADMPFEVSKKFSGLRFLGRASDYLCGDTIYPTWAEDGNLYTPYTDGTTDGVRAHSSGFIVAGPDYQKNGFAMKKATTGHAVMLGDDPLSLEIKSIGVHQADPFYDKIKRGTNT